MRNIIPLLIAACCFFTVTSLTIAQPVNWYSGNTLIIDVRTVEEFEKGHLQGAVNIPYDSIEEQIRQYAADQSAPIMVYCRSGRRSAIAKNSLEKIGYINVTDGGSFAKLKELQP